MPTELCHYSVVRYVADPERGESRNIGVVLLGPASGFAALRLGWTRAGINRSSTRYSVLRNVLEGYRFEVSAHSQPHLWHVHGEWTPRVLERLHQDNIGLIQFSRPAAAKAEPDKLLRQLFERLVATRRPPRGSRLTPARVANVFRHVLEPLGRDEWVEEHPIIELGEDRFEFDVAIKNGRLYYALETISFRNQDLQRAEETGGWYAHVWPRVQKATNAQAALVVEPPVEAGLAASRFERVTRWASDAGIELVDAGELPEFASGVADRLNHPPAPATTHR